MNIFKYICLVTIVFTTSYAQDKSETLSQFMQICTNPTPAQHITLQVMFRGEDVTKKGEYDIQKCKELEEFQNNAEEPVWHGDYTRITAVGKDITDISPLMVYKHAEDLGIIGSEKLKDISVLKYMPKLKRLRISEVPTNDISVLSKLKNLEWIHLSQNSLKDLKPLENLPKLSWINLWGDYDDKNFENINIEEFNRLPNYTDITQEDIKNAKKSTPIDLSALRTLPNLKILTLNGINPKDICALNGSKSLEELVIRSYYVFNANCLTDLPNLKKLTIDYVDDVSGLNKLKSLEELRIEYSLIKDFNGLTSLDNLVFVRVNRSLVEDTSALIHNKNLKGLDTFDNPYLRWCAPKTVKELKDGHSCLNEDGTLKPLWKRVLRF